MALRRERESKALEGGDDNSFEFVVPRAEQKASKAQHHFQVARIFYTIIQFEKRKGAGSEKLHSSENIPSNFLYLMMRFQGTMAAAGPTGKTLCTMMTSFFKP